MRSLGGFNARLSNLVFDGCQKLLVIGAPCDKLADGVANVHLKLGLGDTQVFPEIIIRSGQQCLPVVFTLSKFLYQRFWVWQLGTRNIPQKVYC